MQANMLGHLDKLNYKSGVKEGEDAAKKEEATPKQMQIVGVKEGEEQKKD